MLLQLHICLQLKPMRLLRSHYSDKFSGQCLLKFLVGLVQFLVGLVKMKGYSPCWTSKKILVDVEPCIESLCSMTNSKINAVSLLTDVMLWVEALNSELPAPRGGQRPVTAGQLHVE